MPDPEQPDSSSWVKSWMSPVQREFYRQGSESCRNYSQLTQRVRTIALIAAIAAIAAPLSDLVNANALKMALLPAGILLGFAALSLLLVDWHYQSAFEAKRNVLARIELSLGQIGPWRAHFNVRGSWQDCIASYLPFALLFAIATFAACARVTTGASTAADSGVAAGGDLRWVIKFPWWGWVIICAEGVAFLTIVFVFCRKHEDILGNLPREAQQGANASQQHRETESSSPERSAARSG